MNDWDAKQSTKQGSGLLLKTGLLVCALLLGAKAGEARPLPLLPETRSTDPPLQLKPVDDSFPDFRFSPPPVAGLNAPDEAEFWQEAAPDSVYELMKRDWHIADSPALMRLARFLLRTSAPPPKTKTTPPKKPPARAPKSESAPIKIPADPTQFWRYKMKRLFDIGALETLKLMEVRQPALLVAPTFWLVRAEMALAENRPVFACRLVKKAADEPLAAAERALLPVLTSVCELYQGELDKARLSLRFLQEQNYDGAFFMTALEATLNQGNAPLWQETAALDARLWHIYHLTGNSPPVDALAQASPALLPMLAKNETLPPDFRLAAALRASARQSLKPELLRSLLQDKAPVFNPALTPSQQPEALLRLQTLLGELPPTDYLGVVYAYAPELRRLLPDPALVEFAPTAIRVLLLLDRRAHIADWLALIHAQAPEGDYPPVSGVRWLLKQITPPEDAILPLFPESEERARQEKTNLVAALEAGIFGDASPIAPRQSEAALLVRASAGGHRGEAALRALLLLGEHGGPANAPPAMLRTALITLRDSGFSRAARGIAMEALVLHAR